MSSLKPDVAAAAIDALLQRVFGLSVPMTYQRAPDGVSAQVYQVQRGSQTFYLRIAEEADENLETDAELHERLRDAGVKVARVIHVEPFDTSIGRSVMITTEVPGICVAEISAPPLAASIVAEAGSDLAALNQLPVDGFGWVQRRGRQWPLKAEHTTYPPFLTSYLPQPWPGPLSSLFPTPVLGAIEALIEHQRRQAPSHAVLAHGDFDVTAIFCADGRYTGLIDFGEIRGTEPLFDLGHFHLHDQETMPTDLLPALLTGYQRVQALPEDPEQSIRRSAILLGLRQLCRWLGPPRGYPLDHSAVAYRVQRIIQLVAQHPG
jgi:aminoglycoside phosphotransferase (APT) family kinase protein